MRLPATRPDRLPTEAWGRLESILRRFEDAWKRGERPRPEDYLDAEGAEREALLAELVLEDLELRLRDGQEARAEDYLGRFPELNRRGFVLDLVAAEDAYRRQLGRGAPPDEYLGRFPGLGDELLSRLARRPADAGPSGPHGLPGYEILGELGRGGMGVVYKARQLALNRTVALKIVRSGAQEDSEAHLRFLREAELVAKVQHPNVVQIHDVITHDGATYLALEYVDGPTLARRCDHRPQPPQTAGKVVEILARAVHHVHLQGVIHRDLKPGNVMLSGGKVPKVMDFGLAREVEAGGDLTRTRAIMGTPSYMAPEQASGRNHDVGPLTDVYALGAILYELLTGRPPFLAETVYDTLNQVVAEDPVPPRALQPKIPRDLETICLKCLQKDPARRYASAAELAEDLGRFRQGRPVMARPAGAVERGRRWWDRNRAVARLLAAIAVILVVATATATALAVYGAFEAARADQEAETARRREAEARLAQGSAQEQARAALEQKQRADGETARAKASEEQTARERERAEQALQQVGREKEARDRQLSVARQNLMTAQLVRAGAIYEHDPMGARELLHDLDACPLDLRDAAWRFYERACSRWDGGVLLGGEVNGGATALSPDGKTLAVAHDDTVRLVDFATREERASWKAEGGTFRLAFSPDGKLLAGSSATYDQKKGGWTAGEVRVWEAANGRTRDVFKGYAGEIVSLAWSPDGKALATTDGTLREWDVTTGQERFATRRAAGVMVVAYTPDGKSLAGGAQDGTVRYWSTTTGQERGTFNAHSQAVRALAFSPDGQLLATASEDRAVKLWQVAGNNFKATFQGDRTSVTSLFFSPDGQSLAGIDGRLRLWNVGDRQELAVLRPEGGLSWAAFTPDGKAVVAWDLGLRVWKLPGPPEPRTLRGHTAWVGAIRLSRDGKLLASASADGTVRLWDVASGRERAAVRGLRIPGAVALSPDGNTLAWGSQDDTVRLWDVPKNQERLVLKGHAAAVTCLAFSPDGGLLVSGSLDKTVRGWDAVTGEQKVARDDHQTAVQALAFSPDGSFVATTGATGKIVIRDGRELRPEFELEPPASPYGSYVSLAFSPDGKALAWVNGEAGRCWDLTTRQERVAFRSTGNDMTSVAFSPDGKTLATGSDTDLVWLRDAATGQERATIKGRHEAVRAVAFSPAGDSLISAGDDATIRVWDLGPPSQDVAVIQGKPGDLCESLAFSPDDGVLAGAMMERTVRLWELATGQQAAQFQGGPAVRGLTFSPDGKTLAGLSRASRWNARGSARQAAAAEVRLWDPATGKELPPLQGPPAAPAALAFSPDGRTLALASDAPRGEDKPGSVGLWDLATRQPVLRFENAEGDFRSLAFSPDGKLLAAGSGVWDDGQEKYVSGEVRLWDVAGGKEQGTLKGPAGAVLALAFSPDGRTLAGGSGDNTVRLWDVRTGEELQVCRGHGSAVTAVAFHPSGKVLASGGWADGTVRIWDAATGRPRDVIRANDLAVMSVCFSHDGRWLAYSTGGTMKNVVRLREARPWTEP